ncbi:uncharacterized protein LOC130015304 [Mercurialis annua]|uniref:uncharacterized protein LOC130015304 n=1 Tax=Mercurialis annua TaxID=3986 RepID=UPI0024AD861D|nr:uncharacterized protein LOC130015304 [Mercurialis annua]
MAKEDIEHFFVSCPFAQNLWSTISSIFGRKINSYGSLQTLIMDASKEKFSPQIYSVWNVAVVTTVWLIWKHRNLIIFEDHQPNIHGVIRKIFCALKDCGFLKLRHCNNSLSDMTILSRLHIRRVPKKSIRVVSVYWRPPPTGWIKVNTDGSALGTPGPAGGGGIFRNARGYCQGCFSINMGVSFAFLAEIEAAIFAVLKAADMGFQFVWLECDSIYVVNLFKRKDMQIPWKLRVKWIACLKYINSINFVVSHIFREGNGVADILAHHGVSIQGSGLDRFRVGFGLKESLELSNPSRRPASLLVELFYTDLLTLVISVHDVVQLVVHIAASSDVYCFWWRCSSLIGGSPTLLWKLHGYLLVHANSRSLLS